MKKLLNIIGICLATLSCERRELTYDYSDYCDVSVNVDWSALSESPSGMSLYFYPQDGSAMTLLKTNDVESGTVSLKKGTYDIIIFNLSTDEFGSLTFSGMDSFDTAEATVTETKSDWYSSRADDEVVSRTPEELAAKTYVGFEVTDEMVLESTKNSTKSSSRVDALYSLDFAPQLVVTTSNIKVKVSGLNNLLSANGTMGGMSAGYNFSNQTTHTSNVTHLLEDWSFDYDEDSETDGYISTTFATFGLPGATVTTRSDFDWEGSFWAELLLVDNATKITVNANLNENHITYIDNDDSSTSTSIAIEMGTNSESDPIASGDGTIVHTDSEGTETTLDVSNGVSLPDVVPEGATGGFTAEVEGWGESENVNIEL